MARRADFWRAHLAAANPLLELPLDKTRPTRRTIELGTTRWRVSAAAAEALRSVAASHGLQASQLVLAAFQALLARISRQEAVTIGCNVHGMLLAEVEAVAAQQRPSRAGEGACTPEPSCDSASLQPVRDPAWLAPLCMSIDVEADSLVALARRVSTALAELEPHVLTPLPDICAAIGASPSSAYRAIFQAAFLQVPRSYSAEEAAAAAVAAMHPNAGCAGGRSAALVRAHFVSSSFSFLGASAGGGAAVAPLDLLMLLHGEGAASADAAAAGVGGLLAFSTDVFDAELMQLLAEHFEVFLTSACAAPDSPLGGLDMMSSSERHQVLHKFNDTGVPPPEHQLRSSLVHRQFVAQAAARPDATCLIFEGETMTYRQVDEASNRLANHLVTACGVAEGDIVGLMAPRSQWMVVAMLSILKAGAAYLPLDSAHPPERTAFIVADAGLKVVITAEELAGLLPPASAALAQVVLPPGGLGPEVAAASAASPGARGQLHDLAYLIYTSGSTGNPKGVMVEHRNLVAFLAWQAAEFGYGARDVFLQKTPTNFDVSIEELWTPLVCGAALVIAKPSGHKDTGYLLDLIETHGITSLSMVPSQIAMLLLEAEQPRVRSLKRILSAGEALTSSLAAQMARVLPDVALINAYGPTESTVYITHHLVDPRQPSERPTVSIGRPLLHSQAYVVDSKNRLCAIGVPGELLVSGPQVARGYLNLPDKTSQVFIPNPFADAAAVSSRTGIAYRTGDLARFLPDGRIECLGRTDHQVKLRGFRIELQEIESALVAQGLQAAVCSIAKDAAGQARLVAHAELAAGAGPLDRAALRNALARRLPAYFLPDALVVLPALPRLSNEKIARQALPAPDWAADAFAALGQARAAGGSGGGGSEPKPYAPEQLAGSPVLAACVCAWAAALSLDPDSLGPDSDWHGTCGGNSLQAGHMAASVRKALALPKLSGLLIFQHSRLADFVAAVQQQAEAAAKPVASAAPAGTQAHDEADRTDAADAPPPPHRRAAALPLWLATLLQLLAAALCAGCQLVLSLAPILTVQVVMATLSEWTALAFLPVAKVLILLSCVLLHCSVKWLLVGCYRPGVKPLFGGAYVASWTERVLFQAVKASLLPFTRGTVLHNGYFRLLGAKVAADAVVDAEDVSEYDLVEIEPGAFIGGNAVISPGSKRAPSAKQEGYPYGTLTTSPIRVGRGAVVSGLCVLAGPGASVPDGAVLPPNSSSTDPDALLRGAALGAAGLRLADRPVTLLPALAALLLVILFESIMLAPATIGVLWLFDSGVSTTAGVPDTTAAMLECWMLPETARSAAQRAECNELALAEVVALALFPFMLLLSNVLLMPLLVVPLKWAMLGRVTKATLASSHPLRRWSIHAFACIQRSQHVRLPALMLQGTEPWNVFLRCLGYKIGRQSWLGNHNMPLTTPDLVSIGSTVSMGSDVHFYNATPTGAGRITIEDGVDIGHQATLFPNARLQPGCVLGAKSNVFQDEALPGGAIRLGTAMLRSGKDAEAGGNGADPAGRLVSPLRYALCNAAMLAGNLVFIPAAYALLTLPLLVCTIAGLYEGSGMLVVPAVLVGFSSTVVCGIVALGVLRRLLIPSTPGVHDFWSPFFVRWYIWTGPFCVAMVWFTPYRELITWLYRGLGTRIGRGCCIGGGWSAEPDALQVGDHAVLETFSAASNHTIERRKLSISPITLGDRCTLGVYAVAFPESAVEADGTLDHCSVLLKGERLAGTWRGIPAEPTW